MKKLTIGLFGFGVVGEGIYQVLSQKAGLQCRIKTVCIKQADKKRAAPAHLFTSKAEDILNDPEIDVVVELIDDSVAAFRIVRQAMENGKSVISANKKMIAENLAELICLQQQNKVSFLYEAAVCGSIPILRNLEEYFDNDLLNYVYGIVNGSTNYILSKMSDGRNTYSTALLEAQQNGFAESDPTLDVEGTDAAYKLGIVALHAFGKLVRPEQILRKGITSLRPADFQYAKEKGLVIKLLATTAYNAGTDELYTGIFPTFLPGKHALSRIDREYNGLLIGSSLADEQLLSGKGAGRFPTSSAVLSDVSALRFNYKYEYRKGVLESYQPDAALKKTFYLSIGKEVQFNTALFDHIYENYHNGEGSYFIGDISIDRLRNDDSWRQAGVSLIAFHRD